MSRLIIPKEEEERKKRKKKKKRKEKRVTLVSSGVDETVGYDNVSLGSVVFKDVGRFCLLNISQLHARRDIR